MNKNQKAVIPEGVAVFTDPRTQVKSVALPFQFPDGTNGIITITKITRFGWEPEKEVKQINIEFI